MEVKRRIRVYAVEVDAPSVRPEVPSSDAVRIQHRDDFEHVQSTQQNRRQVIPVQDSFDESVQNVT